MADNDNAFPTKPNSTEIDLDRIRLVDAGGKDGSAPPIGNTAPVLGGEIDHNSTDAALRVVEESGEDNVNDPALTEELVERAANSTGE